MIMLIIPEVKFHSYLYYMLEISTSEPSI